MNKYTLLYLVFVGVFGALLTWWSRRKIFNVGALRQKHIRDIKQFSTIQTSSPFEHPNQKAKQSAVESVEKRFSNIQNLTFFAIIMVWVIALVFPFLNEIPATIISLLVAASGIILGIAARPLIENLISGMVISFSQPIRIGDTVLIDDKYGTIEDITLTYTLVKIWNWRRYIIPNSQMLTKEFINYTIRDSYQWTHVEFFVSYEHDIDMVKQLTIEFASKSDVFANYEPPRFWVMGMEEKGYKCWVVAWADSPSDAWALSNDIRTALIAQFRVHGIKTHKFDVNFQPSSELCYPRVVSER